MSKTKIVLAVFFLLLATLACNALVPSTAETTPTTVSESNSTSNAENIPLTEAEVPRVSLEQAKAAFDNGEAVIVDVRSRESYSASHIPGAINIPLNEIEANPAQIGLPKDQWIITYCT